MTVKEHKEAKLLMTKIINAAKTIRRDAHEFHLHDETFAQMSCLIIFVEKAKVLLDTLKPQQPADGQPEMRDLYHEPNALGMVMVTAHGQTAAAQEVLVNNESVHDRNL